MSHLLFIQACNGALIALLSWMLLFSCLYLASQWRRFEHNVRHVYYVSKMAIAMAIFLLGFLIDRVAAAIWLKNMKQPPHYDFSAISIPMLMLMVGALLAILGGACWIRVLAPERGPLCSWPVVMLSSIAMGYAITLL